MQSDCYDGITIRNGDKKYAWVNVIITRMNVNVKNVYVGSDLRIIYLIGGNKPILLHYRTGSY